MGGQAEEQGPERVALLYSLGGLDDNFAEEERGWQAICRKYQGKQLRHQFLHRQDHLILTQGIKCISEVQLMMGWPVCKLWRKVHAAWMAASAPRGTLQLVRYQESPHGLHDVVP